ncbi:hypothetical protein NVI2019_PEGOAJLN_01101 [Providencia alcalifaciens]|uniref:hypothetical protein n=1 Tax=Providencia TaxID=586 RepID=UPI0004456C14|nr:MULTISPECIES: hypothetical protein [Providencia]EUD04310.1 hypothetical protein HMPREF1565_0762 [Providencia alcalifaciens RIMD 1656011]EUD08778.1 hypothetical protein HMPREF1564_3735 [Providencia alcalifaciens R90-1475]CAG9414414.1 hypothetical protein NVI2019_PEGOAJLN_01101 [Providencia alcalifaciens]
MKLFMAIFIQLIVILGINTASASALVKSLSNCDAGFFKEASKNKGLNQIFNEFYQQKMIDGNAFIKPISIQDGKLKLEKFSVEYTDFNKYKGVVPNAPTGEYYFWGFETNQPFNDVIKALSPQIDLVKVSDDSYVYNAMYRNSVSDKWLKNNSPASNMAPDEESAEKLFIIEVNSDKKVTLFCTIQGKVDQKDLRESGLIK